MGADQVHAKCDVLRRVMRDESEDAATDGQGRTRSRNVQVDGGGQGSVGTYFNRERKVEFVGKA